MEALDPVEAIRSDAVLARYPIHQLSKSGNVPIRLIRRSPEGGQIEFRWEVIPNPKTGEPRALAYKLDTIVINRRLDELGRDFPRLIKLGSLRQMARELHLGGNTEAVKRALEQNADTTIVAKLSYATTDGREEEFEARGTRYNLFFRSATLPSGRRSDAVYLSFNDPFYSLHLQTPRRPLDYQYLKELPPAAQRWYELASFEIFAAIKHGRAQATMRYSSFCQASAITRSSTRQKMQPQMSRIHRPHKESGYIKSVSYEATVDEEGQADWLFHYRPGPRALREFDAFNKQAAPTAALESAAVKKSKPVATAKKPVRREKSQQLEPAIEVLTARGITATKARALRQSFGNDAKLLATLEYGDYLMENMKRGSIRNPAGFLVHLIEERVEVPDWFETSAERGARDRQQHDQKNEQQRRDEAELAYRELLDQETDAYVTRTYSKKSWQKHLNLVRDELLAGEYGEALKKWEASALDAFVLRQARAKCREHLELPDFESFYRSQAS